MKQLMLWLSFSALLQAQVATEANKGYQTPEARRGVAAGLGSEGRDREQKPKELIALLEIQPGMTVADVGTGIGYLLPFLSQAVGPSGKVIGEDIFPDFLERARERSAKLPNVILTQGTERDPKLPEGQLDLVLTLDVYHHFDYPAEMLKAIRRSLKPEGRFALVDYYRSREAMDGGRALSHIRLDRDAVIREVEANGFRLLRQGEHLPKRQYFAIFQPSGPAPPVVH